MAKLGNVPSEAQSGAQLNETIPTAQRTAATRTEMSEGPRRGEAGEYLPATYQLPEKEVELKNGKILKVRRVREDR